MILLANPGRILDLLDALEKGWRFDPWLCPKGYPIAMNDQCSYWVLVRGEGEALLDLYPFIDLSDEPSTQLERQLRDAVDIVQVDPEKAVKYKEKGYVYTGKWKGLVELTLYSNGDEEEEDESSKN